MKKFYCAKCNRVFPEDLVVDGVRHRVVQAFGPDIWHLVIELESS